MPVVQIVKVVGVGFLIPWLAGSVLTAFFPDAIPAFTGAIMGHLDMQPVILADVLDRHLSTIDDLTPQELEDVANTPVPLIDKMQVQSSYWQCLLKYGSSTPCDFDRMYLEKQLEVWKWNP